MKVESKGDRYPEGLLCPMPELHESGPLCFLAWSPCAVTVGADGEDGARTELVRGARERLQRV